MTPVHGLPGSALQCWQPTLSVSSRVGLLYGAFGCSVPGVPSGAPERFAMVAL